MIPFDMQQHRLLQSITHTVNNVLPAENYNLRIRKLPIWLLVVF